ncbi:hypothetical protein O1611_g6904 [Lasiodiplodia mahajangana]|uniref:Uncharacterized protein n=1 Tax=Lasiodiplodia mahajangana TaxID=1108764 RepID=A0ACC2JH89_9PEZI|nr:hypothetical protein O1611_g6904 [Lasiodiplodia mahajangana]
MAELKEAVARDSLVVEKFLGRNHAAAVQYLSMLNYEYGITLESWGPKDSRYIPTYEKSDITATLMDISSLLVDLSDYTHVTQCAVGRIGLKLVNTLDEVESLNKTLEKSYTLCVEYLQGINTILQSFHYTEEYNNQDTTSLLLPRFISYGNIRDLKEVSRALQQDSPDGLEKCFHDRVFQSASPSRQVVLLILIKIGILCSSDKCLSSLQPQLNTRLCDPRQRSVQNPLRVYILHVARIKDQSLATLAVHPGIRLMLDNIPSSFWLNVLLCPDSLGRLAIHYAARYGMTAACKAMIERLELVAESSAKDILPIFLIPDQLGETPLSIAISHGHTGVLKLFLHQLGTSNTETDPPGAKIFEGIFFDMVSLAIRSQRTYITEIIIDCESQILTIDSKIHQLLYLASQYGQASIVGRLLKHVSNINEGDQLRGRTPLMVASIYEHMDVVQALLAHPSCDIRVRDHDGWTAVDHAAFKGPPDLVKMLQDHKSWPYSPSLEHAQRIDLPARYSRTLNNASITMGSDKGKQDSSHIFMNLGHFDMDKEPLTLQLDPFRQLVAPMQVPDSSLILEISTVNCDSTRPYLVSFPVLEDLSNDPLYFTAKDPNTAKLLFKVYSSALRKDAHSRKPSLIGSAAVSLRDLRQGLGPSLESLERDHTVSLVSPDAFGNTYAGSLTFTFVLSKPFTFQGPPPTTPKITLRRDGSPLVAGHRGLGENDAHQNRLQLGENTIDSCFAALDLGADILEVLLSPAPRANVFANYFLVCETGTDAPMHTLTYEQFMVPSRIQDNTTRPSKSGLSPRTAYSKIIQRPRSNSEGEPHSDNADLVARLMATFNIKKSGFKGNVGGECIHGPFTTLEQLLVRIDEPVCFDIELKYPMLFEARDFNMDTFAMELNLYLDTVLTIVYKYGGNRPIFFSSFSPELCILLKAKQQVYPVLFLTEAGYIPTRDIRAISFQEAVRFAKKWNLEGVVIRSQSIIPSPTLIELVQADAHIDAFITNRVGEVVRTLGRRPGEPVF